MKPAVSVESDNTIAAKINTRFEHFLVGKNYVLGDEDLNDGLGLDLLEKEEQETEETSGWTRRVLLDVEKARVEKEMAAKRQRQKELEIVSSYFRKRFVSDLMGQLSEEEKVLNGVLRFHQSTVDLLNTLSLPFPRLSVIASMLDQHPEIRRRLLYLVSNASFMEMMKRKPRTVKDPQAVVGLMGVEILKYIVPAMLFKYRIRMNSSVIPMLGQKLWRHVLTTSVSTAYILEKQGYKRPTEGVVLGGLMFLGHMAGIAQFYRSFDESMVETLNDARQKGDKKLHDLLFDVEADPRVLEKLLAERASEISLMLVKKAFGDTAPQLITALQEEVQDISFDMRSTLGKALYQGVRFSKFDQLRAAKQFFQDDLAPWIQYCRLDQALFKEMHKKGMNRIDYARFS